MGTTFKEAKIGQIPADWKLVKFEDIGVTYGGLTNKNKGDFGKGKPYIPFLNIMNNTKIDLDYFDYVDVQESEKQNRTKKGDLFFNTSSETPEEVGMCSVLCDDVPELYLNSFCFGFRIEDQNSLLPLFVSYFFRSGVGRKVIFPLAQGMTRYNLSKRYFLQLEIPKPKTEEQHKIAEILSTVDETIEKTDAIIQKTQQLKKSLMQKLFTEGIGHTRFKETKIGTIPEEWEVVRLAKVSEIRFSNVDKKSYPGEIPVHLCNYLDVYNNEYIDEKIDFMEATATTAEIEKFSLYKGDVIITKDSETADDIAVPSVVIEELNNVLCGYHLALLQPNAEKVDSIFLSKLLSSTPINNQFVRLSQGLTRFGLNVSSIQNAIIPLPSLDEQHQIAQILSEVDYKTEKEQAFKEELEKLKKGLMQVLLTGKVRVKI